GDGRPRDRALLRALGRRPAVIAGRISRRKRRATRDELPGDYSVGGGASRAIVSIVWPRVSIVRTTVTWSPPAKSVSPVPRACARSKDRDPSAVVRTSSRAGS